MARLLPLCAALLLLLAGCADKTETEKPVAIQWPKDAHSYARPSEIAVQHVALDLNVDFKRRVLYGSAALTLDKPGTVTLDSKKLTIEKAEHSTNQQLWLPTKFNVGKADALLGAPVTVEAPAGSLYVRLTYTTAPDAPALQWLEPAQTAGKTGPFLFTQSQAIHARSWIPLQDTPSVRITYSARIRCPKDLTAVMSAINDTSHSPTGDYRFEMPQRIPSYLIALAVGDLRYRPMGGRTAIYTEKPLIDTASKELEVAEHMIRETERLFGPYRWERYDILVLPPSFPIGGMENPRLTFATPTILAGDRSLVSLIAHELAHSWSGNLVTNATWRDFWLNEGFTTYLERRVQEQVFGEDRSEMEFALEIDELKKEMAALPPAEQVLHVDLTGRDPDEGFTLVPYVKGALMLRAMEEELGREDFDQFLRDYFEKFSFQSITTEQFLVFLKARLPQLRLDVNEWLEKPGLPASTPKIRSREMESIAKYVEMWNKGKMPEPKEDEWSTQHFLQFLRQIDASLSSAQMAKLDAKFQFTKSTNAEIASQWLSQSVKHGYAPATARTEEYLREVGRQKLIRPIYEAMCQTPAGRQRARAIFERVKKGYHPIAITTISRLLG
jgi:leukotriene-A4 hydrolase